jgi:hypothetical protein
MAGKNAATPPVPRTVELDITGTPISEKDFAGWKHHPVTKVLHRFLADYERQLAEKQISMMRQAHECPDAFKIGMFNGQINAVSQVAALGFEDLVAFYDYDVPDMENQE